MNLMVKDTQLTSIADAIRTKTGGSSGIAFPDGFISKIGEIKNNMSISATYDFGLIIRGTTTKTYSAGETIETFTATNDSRLVIYNENVLPDITLNGTPASGNFTISTTTKNVDGATLVDTISLKTINGTTFHQGSNYRFTITYGSPVIILTT